MKKVILFAIKVYQACFSPFLGPSCRFYPSCSAYAEQAVREKGAKKGSVIAVKRLLKCHPFHPGGFDPVES